jgi:hypothetical protein
VLFGEEAFQPAVTFCCFRVPPREIVKSVGPKVQCYVKSKVASLVILVERNVAAKQQAEPQLERSMSAHIAELLPPSNVTSQPQAEFAGLWRRIAHFGVVANRYTLISAAGVIAAIFSGSLATAMVVFLLTMAVLAWMIHHAIRSA